MLQEAKTTQSRSLKRKAPEPVTALQLLRQSLASQSQCFYLMRYPSLKPPSPWLRLRPGKIHELVGPAGSGKSQTALSLCLQAARQNHQALYLSLRGPSALRKMLQRLHQMCSGDETLLTRILTRCVVETDDLWALLFKELPQLLQEQSGVRVLVLDSLADLLRGQFMAVNNKDLNPTRSSWLMVVASQLLKCASDHGVSIVVLNQVSFGDNVPALGLSWKHCVQESFLLSRQGNQRRVSLLKSATFPCGGPGIEFVIGTEGVTLVNPTHTQSRPKQVPSAST